MHEDVHEISNYLTFKLSSSIRGGDVVMECVGSGVDNVELVVRKSRELWSTTSFDTSSANFAWLFVMNCIMVKKVKYITIILSSSLDGQG